MGWFLGWRITCYWPVEGDWPCLAESCPPASPFLDSHSVVSCSTAIPTGSLGSAVVSGILTGTPAPASLSRADRPSAPPPLASTSCPAAPSGGSSRIGSPAVAQARTCGRAERGPVPPASPVLGSAVLLAYPPLQQPGSGAPPDSGRQRMHQPNKEFHLSSCRAAVPPITLLPQLWACPGPALPERRGLAARNSGLARLRVDRGKGAPHSASPPSQPSFSSLLSRRPVPRAHHSLLVVVPRRTPPPLLRLPGLFRPTLAPRVPVACLPPRPKRCRRRYQRLSHRSTSSDTWKVSFAFS